MTTPDPSLPPIPPAVSSNDKLLIILCHLSLIAGSLVMGMGFLLPLIVFLVRREDSAIVAAHAKESLNFQLSVLVYAVVSLVLSCVFIGFPLLIALGLGSVICSIIAAIKASEEGFYRYPLTIRFIS